MERRADDPADEALPMAGAIPATPVPDPRRTRIFRIPALHALALQAVSLLAVILLLHAGWMLFGLRANILSAAFLQGALAAILSWRRLAPWWIAIQFVFAPALIAAQSLQVPPLFFLAAFALLLGLYWTTFRTQVPFYPSGPRTWESVAGLLPQQPVRFIDIGSGLGGLVLDLARRRPESSFTGIEVAPLPWAASRARAWFARRRHGGASRFLRGDYNRLDLAQHDVVFAYLSPAAMPALWRKAAAEMRPGSLLLSYEFPVPDAAPDLVVHAEAGGPALYGWRM